jgi:hypothetical protein
VRTKDRFRDEDRNKVESACATKFTVRGPVPYLRPVFILKV